MASLCYLLGAYLRLHDPLRGLSARAALLGALALAGLSGLGSGLLSRLPAGPLAQAAAKLRFHDFTSPCVVGIAVLVFALCQKIPARAGTGGAFRALAAATLGVYLIHVQPCFWRRVFVPRMGALAASSAWGWLARGLGLSLAVFAACLALRRPRERKGRRVICLIVASLKDLGKKCFAFTKIDAGEIAGLKAGGAR